MRKRIVTALTWGLGVWAFAAQANEQVTPSAGLLELFTSHGCYSCPPADRLLKKLDETEDVVALEFHVDYWDQLVWGQDGSWKDPYSSSAYTQRQRLYQGRGLSGRAGVYTPQLVIQGQVGEVGSRERKIRKRIRQFVPESVNFHWQDAPQGWTLSVGDAVPKGAEMWVARFIRETETKITGGENAGKQLRNHNVVTQLTRLESLPNQKRHYEVRAPEQAGLGCAVWLQKPNQGEVLAASYCP